MRRHRIVLGIASVIAAMPIVALLLRSIPNVLLFMWASLSSEVDTLCQTLLVPIIFIMAFFPLWVFLSLVIETAKAAPYRLGVAFWSGLAVGLVLAVYVYIVFAPAVALIVSCPLLFTGAYACFIQKKLPGHGYI